MSLRVKGERVLIELDKPQETIKLKSVEIYIPQEYQRKSMTGVVKGVGDKVDLSRYEFKIGDKVVFKRFIGYDVNIGEKEYKICHPDDILGIVEN